MMYPKAELVLSACTVPSSDAVARLVIAVVCLEVSLGVSERFIGVSCGN